MKTGSTRWWYKTDDGEIVAVVLAPHETPQPHWVRGLKPQTSEKLEQHIRRISALHRGVPKSSRQRERMSAAKRGVPKSDQHREAMSRAHKLRSARIHELMRHYPHLTYNECSSLEAKLLRSNEQPEWFKLLLQAQHDKE